MRHFNRLADHLTPKPTCQVIDLKEILSLRKKMKNSKANYA